MVRYSYPGMNPWVSTNRTQEQPALSNSAAARADSRLDEADVASGSFIGYRLAGPLSSARADSQESRRFVRYLGPLRGTLGCHPCDASLGHHERQRGPFVSRYVRVDEEVL